MKGGGCEGMELHAELQVYVSDARQWAGRVGRLIQMHAD